MCLHRVSNIPEQFTFFWKGELSQWHLAKIQVRGIEYSTCEQYMMACKARLFQDSDTLAKIVATDNPREQKALGREVKNFDKDQWDAVARDYVYEGNYAKFTQHPTLKKLLLATAGTTLVEASPKDSIWGIGLSADDPAAQSRDTWNGLNWLGETLTKVRDDIIKAERNAPVSDGVPKAESEIKLIEFLEKSVDTLCKEALAVYKNSMVEIKDLIDKGSITNKKRLNRVLSRLSAINMLTEYDNIEVSQHRGVRYIRSLRNFSFGAPDAIEPSGKESASILLYSGMDQYTDDIPNEDVLR